MRRLLLLISFAVTASLAAATAPPAAIAFIDVTVVPMDRERLIANQTVIVSGERIAEIGPAAKVKVPEGALRVDARGKFLMPGLSEMHAHIPGGQAPDELVERTLYLFASAGVTTIRGMLGHSRHLTLRDRAARGDIVSPTIYTAGPSFNGQSATSAEQATKMVADQKAAGYDLLKIHPGLTRPVFDAIVAEANKQRIPFAGHVPVDVGVDHALDSRYASIDHIDGYVEALVRDGTPKEALSNAGWFGHNLVPYVDETKIAPLVAKTRAAGVWIVPTENLMEIFMSTDDPETFAKRPEIQYMPRPMVEGWIKQRKEFLSQPDITPEKCKAFLALRKRLIKALHDGGVGLLLGSDAVQTMSVPGFSIHGELQAIARAGLTPFQVYTTGSTNVAKYFGVEQQVGTVAKGMRADLVLVDANPLADVANFPRQSGVMIRGRWLPRAEISKRLSEYSQSLQ
jgi:imidazolonepropionase-like amidohydrolase